MTEYEAYIELCKEKGLQPVASSLELAALQELSALGPHVIPYMTPNGTTWVHNTQHKTKRKDRPFMVANMQALQEK